MRKKTGYMALKLDMSKAYDRVEWGLLEGIMLKIGFAPKWIQMVMTCVSTVSYSVLINGQPHGKIRPSRGLRQGDPLSPYLFILCAKSLSTSIQRAVLRKEITSLPIARGGVRISHLFFADDNLLFCRATLGEWSKLQEILGVYERASGQLLNRGKTTLFFSRGTNRVTQERIKEAVGVNSTHNYEKYLGLPALIGHSQLQSFKEIEGRIWDRICGWKEKFLSQAGKEVLLKVVLQAIPTYTMSVFQIPKILCKQINSMLQRFWWGHKKNLSKVAWMKWERLGRAKGIGGLGFRDIECFNKALLAKQGWRLVQSPDSFVAQVMKAKYYQGVSFLESNLGSHASFAWRSIWKAKELLQEGMVWRVGDGTSINIWGDRWIPSPTTYSIQSPACVLPPDAKVSCLMEREKRSWNVSLLKTLFSKEETEAICSILLCPGQQPDVKIWAGTKSGEFTVKSAYHLAREILARGEGGCSRGP